jgi:hypothetical protein
MVLKKMATMAAALSLAAGSIAPAMAAQSLSLGNSPAVRASADVGPTSALGGDRDDTWMQIAALVAVVLIIFGITQVLDDDTNFDQPIPNPPASP